MSAVEIAKAKRARIGTEIRKLDDFIGMNEALEREEGCTCHTYQTEGCPVTS